MSELAGYGPHRDDAGRRLSGVHCDRCNCLPPRTQWLIDRQYELSRPVMSPADRLELAAINDELEGQEFFHRRRDPVVQEFLAELHRRRRELMEEAGSGIASDERIRNMVRFLFDERFTNL